MDEQERASEAAQQAFRQKYGAFDWRKIQHLAWADGYDTGVSERERPAEGWALEHANTLAEHEAARRAYLAGAAAERERAQERMVKATKRALWVLASVTNPDTPLGRDADRAYQELRAFIDAAPPRPELARREGE